jgi:asparagine synthase (glutamine-hydrolysing)
MCGIAGVVRFDGEGVSADVLSQMTSLLRHRGPDDEGFWFASGVGLGHRRLSIIDVAGSAQPMVHADERHVIVFNGEIVNYEALRATYNLTCSTAGDTEVLLQLLVLRGIPVLSELRGQFAFALYDTVDGSLLLARDRLGIIPLFTAKTADSFSFASEPKALVPSVGALMPDENHLAELLMFRAVGAPATPFRGIDKVLPGHWVRVDRSGNASGGAYWNLNQPTATSTRSPAQVVDEFDRLLRQSVEENLVADVPVGAYLSGGVDSSLIVAHAAAVHGAGLKTFSAAFDVGFDERPFARNVAERFGTDHYEVVVSASDYFDELQRLTWFRDSPISEPADVAVAALARLASEHVKVVLSGEGSDELFGGYSKYRFAKLAALGAKAPARLRIRGLPVVERIAGTRLGAGIQVLRALEASTDWLRNAAWFASFTEAEVRRLTGNANFSPRPDVVLTGDAVKRMGTVDMTAWLSDNLLERGDRMTMASSIELRPPFLDPRLVDFARSLPSSITNKGNTPKWPVRMAAKRYVDASNIDRPKTGFSVPLSAWFRGDLRERVTDLLVGPAAKSGDLVDANEIRRILNDHQRGKVDAWRQIWALLTLELFCRQLADPAGHAPPSARDRSITPAGPAAGTTTVTATAATA